MRQEGGTMRFFSLLTFLTAVLTFSAVSCAPGVRGGMVRDGHVDAVPEPHDVLIEYSGERGTVEGVEWPDYCISTVDFGDVSIQAINYPGWRTERLENRLVMVNVNLEAMIIISWSRHPFAEVVRWSTQMRARGIEVSNLVIGSDPRMFSVFSFSESDNGRHGVVSGLYTDYRNRLSGVTLIGHWPSEHHEELAPQIERIARNLILRDHSGLETVQ